MDGVSAKKRPQAVLFLCGQNSIRSPMAAAITKHYFGKSIYAASAGVRKGEADPFVTAVMDEIGIDLSKHRPATVEEREDDEGLNFDLAISLSPQAHHRALELTRKLPIEVEYWPTPDPTIAEGSREQKLEAYRNVRDELVRKIKQRFDPKA
ncbi:MAG: arsenate reductase ArsC [Xanthobacteraceae bacterium]|nr:arsenate reductase ArsC [Xanthobacteraceae bacterium]MBX3550550.1 arsenate reductase ArsC [Xanthobacteraceae bacterium]